MVLSVGGVPTVLLAGQPPGVRMSRSPHFACPRTIFQSWHPAGRRVSHLEGRQAHAQALQQRNRDQGQDEGAEEMTSRRHTSGAVRATRLLRPRHRWLQPECRVLRGFLRFRLGRRVLRRRRRKRRRLLARIPNAVHLVCLIIGIQCNV